MNLREDDAVDHVDDTVAGRDIHSDNIGCAPSCVGENAATLE